MKTATVDKHDAANYIKRALECLHAATRAYENEEWNACVINSIHCAIAAADAFCIAKLGVRNSSEKHSDAIQLFISISPGSEEIIKNAKHLTNLLAIKTNAEYGERLLQPKDAENAIKHAERLLVFCKENIKL